MLHFDFFFIAFLMVVVGFGGGGKDVEIAASAD